MIKVVNNDTFKTQYFRDLFDACYTLAEEVVDKDAYNDLLDDCYDPVEIMGVEYDISYVYQKIDPIAYEYSYSEYIDGVASDYHYELKKVDEEILKKGYNFEDLGYTIYDIEDGGEIDE